MRWAGQFLLIFIYPVALADSENKVHTYRIQNGDRNGKAGASVVYSCSAGKETGPCVDSPSLCTSQGGKFVGYCFFEGRYAGVCCPGLDPANATLTTTTTRPPPDNVVQDDPTTTAAPTTTTATTKKPCTTFFCPPTFTTQSPNGTTHQVLFPNFTMTTRDMNSTSSFFPNFTMTTPNMTFTKPTTTATTTTTVATPSETTVETSSEATTETTSSESSTEAEILTTEIIVGTTEATSEASTDSLVSETPPSETLPSLDQPSHNDEGPTGCGMVTSEIQSQFQNPSYPGLDTESEVYEYSVMAQDGYCALRIEFVETILAGKGMEGCSTDSVIVINSEESPTTPLCGLLQGYQLTVKQTPEHIVKIAVNAQSSAYLWSINLTQIPCSNIKPYQDHQSPNCGKKNPKQAPPGVSISNNHIMLMAEEPTLVSPMKLVRTNNRKKTTKEHVTVPVSASTNVLKNAVLNRDSSIKIVRGNETAVNEWPWQALLMVNGRPLCGASVITEEWIATAGHCVQLNLRYSLASALTVDVGDHDLRTTKETKNSIIRVAKIVPHVQNEGVQKDIALIKLATKLEFGKTIRPVCLPTSTPPDSYEDLNGITTGWGRTEDSVISPVLREANIPIISNERCRQQWNSVGEGAGGIIDNGMICAGGGDVGPCNGDSGGPLVVSDENDKWSLVGLTSFGLLKGCAIPGVPSVFTRITEYVDWIALNLAEA